MGCHRTKLSSLGIIVEHISDLMPMMATTFSQTVYQFDSNLRSLHNKTLS